MPTYSGYAYAGDPPADNPSTDVFNNPTAEQSMLQGEGPGSGYGAPPTVQYTLNDPSGNLGQSSYTATPIYNNPQLTSQVGQNGGTMGSYVNPPQQGRASQDQYPPYAPQFQYQQPQQQYQPPSQNIFTSNTINPMQMPQINAPNIPTATPFGQFSSPGQMSALPAPQARSFGGGGGGGAGPIQFSNNLASQPGTSTSAFAPQQQQAASPGAQTPIPQGNYSAPYAPPPGGGNSPAGPVYGNVSGGPVMAPGGGGSIPLPMGGSVPMPAMPQPSAGPPQSPTAAAVLPGSVPNPGEVQGSGLSPAQQGQMDNSQAPPNAPQLDYQRRVGPAIPPPKPQDTSGVPKPEPMPSDALEGAVQRSSKILDASIDFKDSQKVLSALDDIHKAARQEAEDHYAPQRQRLSQWEQNASLWLGAHKDYMDKKKRLDQINDALTQTNPGIQMPNKGGGLRRAMGALQDLSHMQMPTGRDPLVGQLTRQNQRQWGGHEAYLDKQQTAMERQLGDAYNFLNMYKQDYKNWQDAAREYDQNLATEAEKIEKSALETSRIKLLGDQAIRDDERQAADSLMKQAMDSARVSHLKELEKERSDQIKAMAAATPERKALLTAQKKEIDERIDKWHNPQNFQLSPTEQARVYRDTAQGDMYRSVLGAPVQGTTPNAAPPAKSTGNRPTGTGPFTGI
jgi:hypothetical protein